MYRHAFKCILIGDCGVGKTSLRDVFLSKEYRSYHFCSEHFFSKELRIDNENIKLQIWDTQGQERYLLLPQVYYWGVDAVMLTYDITNFQSFDNLREKWNKDVCSKYTQCILVGNKCDLEVKRAVDSTTAMEFAESLKIPFIETSAKWSINVEQAFVLMAAMIMKKLPENESDTFDFNNIMLNSDSRDTNNIYARCLC
ncbi:Ras-related protein ORAB-1 [Oopsacas minuta]|uniref:Ras-related protein ORAB-1 n=1 Tax=Oopsacas minuta TaxID=111878 RepID=A0AAV7KGR9_9METZ|nr:Ras-related protein ORAB-1 [Oopsacas minuta]